MDFLIEIADFERVLVVEKCSMPLITRTPTFEVGNQLWSGGDRWRKIYTGEIA